MRDESNELFQSTDKRFYDALNKLMGNPAFKQLDPEKYEEIENLRHLPFFDQNQKDESAQQIVNKLRPILTSLFSTLALDNANRKNIELVTDLIYNVLTGFTEWQPRNDQENGHLTDSLSMVEIPDNQYLALSNGMLYDIVGACIEYQHAIAKSESTSAEHIVLFPQDMEHLKSFITTNMLDAILNSTEENTPEVVSWDNPPEEDTPSSEHSFSLSTLMQNNIDNILKKAIEKNKLNDVLQRNSYIQNNLATLLTSFMMQADKQQCEQLLKNTLSENTLLALSAGLYQKNIDGQNWLHHVAKQYPDFIPTFFHLLNTMQNSEKKSQAMQAFLKAFPETDTHFRNVLSYAAESESFNINTLIKLVVIKNKGFQKNLKNFCLQVYLHREKDNPIIILANKNYIACLHEIFQIPGLVDSLLKTEKYHPIVSYLACQDGSSWITLLKNINDTQKNRLASIIINSPSSLPAMLASNNSECFEWFISLIEKDQNLLSRFMQSFSNALLDGKVSISNKVLMSIHEKLSNSFCLQLQNPLFIQNILNNQNALSQLFQLAHQLAESTENQNTGMLDALHAALLENGNIKNQWISFIMNKQSPEDKIQIGKLILLELIRELNNDLRIAGRIRGSMREDALEDLTTNKKQKIIYLLLEKLGNKQASVTESVKKLISGDQTLLDVIVKKEWHDVIEQIRSLNEPELNKKLPTSRSRSSSTLFGHPTASAAPEGDNVWISTDNKSSPGNTPVKKS